MRSQRRVIAATSVAVATVAILSACVGQQNPGPTPSGSNTSTVATPTPIVTPTPTWKCSSATGASCTQELAQKEAARAAAYKNAEAAYRVYAGLLDDALRAGGSATLSPQLAKVTGPELAADLASELKDMHDAKRYMSGQSIIKSIKPSQDSPEWPTSELKLDICMDYTKTATLEVGTDKFLNIGQVGTNHATLRLVDGKWILWSQQQEYAPC